MKTRGATLRYPEHMTRALAFDADVYGGFYISPETVYSFRGICKNPQYRDGDRFAYPAPEHPAARSSLLSGSRIALNDEDGKMERWLFLAANPGWLDKRLKAGFDQLAEDEETSKTVLLNEAIADLLKKHPK